MRVGFGSLARALVLCLGAVALLGAPASADPSPVYGSWQGDAITGDNFIPDQGWWVDADADSHVLDPLRERPLSTNTFFSYDNGTEHWVHPGAYYAYLDITQATWGADSKFLYFKMELYGNWDQNDPDAEKKYDHFGNGTYYDILFGQHPDGEANGSMILRVPGDKKETWDDGDFHSLGAMGFLDQNGDVGGTGITVTKEDGDPQGNGFETTIVESDGKLANGSTKPTVLWYRMTTGIPDVTTRSYVEIAFDYATYNAWASTQGAGFWTVDPDLMTFLIWETNRPNSDEQVYMWNDFYTKGDEGSPYPEYDENGDPITQLKNMYELDRLWWQDAGTPVPEPSTALLVLAGAALGYLRLRRSRRGS